MADKGRGGSLSPYLPLKDQAHLVGKGMEKQNSLPPGCIDLIPFHRDTWEAA